LRTTGIDENKRIVNPYFDILVLRAKLSMKRKVLTRKSNKFGRNE